MPFPWSRIPALGLFQLILARFCQRRLCLPQLVLLLQRFDFGDQISFLDFFSKRGVDGL